jgi:preprotein translocase subunit SecF
MPTSRGRFLDALGAQQITYEHRKNLKYFFILPAVLTVLARLALFAWGLKPGIDLAGGSLLQVTYPAGPPGRGGARSRKPTT